MDGKLMVMEDPVADALDDMAALGLQWARNRERGRMPNGIRGAMLLVAREALGHVEMQERETQRRTDELCGPAAYMRNSAPDELIAIGSQMANVFFNFCQEANSIGGRLNDSEREMLKNLRKRWDAAVARSKTPNV